MFFVAAMDLLFAALTTGDTFPGGFFDRVGGHTFLVTGTVAVLLLVPLALTATHRAKRWLGRYWKSFHRLTYVIWGLIVLHLLLLFGFRSFARDAVLLSAALALPRIPAVRRWWATSRRAGAHRVARSALVVMLTSVFVVGYAPFVQELIGVGAAAFHQTPVED
jgi:DMSO/TMAO reductase YedYZ heme-binding membrane subunit